MQSNNIITYHLNDFYLIHDPSYKSEKFIGKVNSIGKGGFATLNIYIFPEDTKGGRLNHMSYYEIFLTKGEISYNFNGEETKVNVTDLPNYIKRKYIEKEDLSIRQLYFQRQKYLENGKFEPELEKVCYCKQIFNPDIIFKVCHCGSFFHPLCFMKSETNKCWNEKCSVDCSTFFSPQEMFDKKKKISQSQIQPALQNSPQRNSIEMREGFFIKENETQNDVGTNIDKSFINNNEISKFDTGELFKKSKRKKAEKNATIEMMLENAVKALNPQDKPKEIKIKQEPFINLGIKQEKANSPIKSTSKLFDTTIYEKKPGGGYQAQIKSEPNTIEENRKKTESERERGRKIIYDNLINGIKDLQKNIKILNDFEKEKPNLIEQISMVKENNLVTIEMHYRELANSIENNLFNNCDKKANPTYFSFLQEFALLIKNSKKILFRVILGDLTSEEISKFKGVDFLPEEKRKEKEALKKKEIQKMKFFGPVQIKAIATKGRMLTEIQDNIEVNKNNIGFDTQINMNVEDNQYFSEYYEKLKLMKEKYPNMNDNDIKFLVEAKEPNEDEIQNKLNSFIQETLDLEEQKELFTFRKEKLRRKAERHFKKIQDGHDKELLAEKMNDYIKSISLDIKPY